ncbi:MAG: YbaY family lipoprotein, partial [Burkholderiales bacterium]|nr:YbaY family lipoprotein [Burkholderiales bacterium]
MYKPFPPTAAIRSLGRGLAACLLAALVWVACAPAWAGTVEGTALYRERIALPPDAVFEAVLQDVSRADAPAEVLGRATIDPAGQPPFRFRIAYDDAAVQPGQRYAVRATVRQQGRLLFTTDQVYPVVPGAGGTPLRMLLVSTKGRPPATAGKTARFDLPASYAGELPGASGGPILWHLDLLPQGRYQLRLTYKDRPEPNRFDDVGRWQREPGTGLLVLRGGRETAAFMPVDGGRVLHKADDTGKPIASGHNYRLQRLPKPALIEPRLALTGMFTYMADAATITLCADDGRLPVVMEADYKALEAAYLKERQQPGQALLVSVEGSIAPRPSMEESQPPRRSLVVERFVNVWPRETCGNPLADSPLRDTYWKLTRLGGEPVRAAGKQREPHLIFAGGEPRVSGSGGCNSVTGSFELDGDRLRLGRMAGTLMAC